MRTMVPVLALLALGGCETRLPVAVIGGHGQVLTGETVANLSGGRFQVSNPSYSPE